MLYYLRIENLALMDRTELEFGRGLTVVTGETGAGKSVLLGALSLLAGNRGEKTIIRQGAESCTVEASLHFEDCQHVDASLEALGLPACEEGQLVLRRVIHRSKPVRVHINGTLATLSALGDLGEEWIDFHGPGEPQKLFRESHQLAMLDRFADNDGLLNQYSAWFRDWRAVLAEAESLRHAERLSPDEAEFIRSQIDAIDAVQVEAGSIAELERDFARIDRAQELSLLAANLQNGINSCSGQLGELLRAAGEFAQIDSSAEDFKRRLEAVVIELDDLASEYGASGESVDMDEAVASEIQERMQSWLSLKRKFGPTVEDVLSKRASLEQRLASQGDIEGQLDKLSDAAHAHEAVLQSLADKLRKARLKAAKTLAGDVQKLLTRLGFKKADFQIAVLNEDELKPHGDSSCQFLFAPNAGQKRMPLNKIASSGETARVMLALKTVLAAADATPVLVFDEVDANVGGEIGAEVGRELAALAGRHQVFCVTHLPQVAAYGRQHLLVEKAQDEASTTVTINAIHDTKSARESELARMLGDRKSKSALQHAKELLCVTT